MRRCNKCRIDFTGDLDICPLCHSQLEGSVTPAVFPNNVMRRSGVMALRILAFATGVGILSMLFLAHLLSIPSGITITICIALALNFLFVRNIMVQNTGFLRAIVRYFLILLAIAALWFIITGNLIVTTYVIPSICLVALVFDTILIVIFRSTFVKGYAKYLLFDVVLGLVPLILVAAGLVTWDLPALISALTASIFLLGLVVFMRRQLLAELRKLFSM